jgi:hypothetical protein
MVKHYYVYCFDDDFGPFFIKFCTYFPYTAKLCINGHEYLKRQLVKRDIEFASLDNGILSCAEPEAMQDLANELTAKRIDALLRKWLRRLLHPFTAKDRAAGYRYQISILQAEFALTQVFDRPANGRAFFEQVIRENLDLGRPEQVQLIFDRRVIRTVDGQRVAALRVLDPAVQSLLSLLVTFCFQPRGFANKDLRARCAQRLGVPPSAMTHRGQRPQPLRARAVLLASDGAKGRCPR